MVGMTPWGVFFLACKLPYTKCWLLCQQAQLETHFQPILRAKIVLYCCLIVIIDGSWRVV